ncbi:DUF6303 family protein [Streptomyces chryseus]|uniref:DUF6303 family protein n=1 Tax=Streptomyces chryseus TaxID=68186 RepID=UPI0019CD6FEE|nr:hypothetical protein GCM10010353_59510 [Streptomyces chryseus]
MSGSRSELSAHLRADTKGWRLWVAVPDVPPARQPSTTFPPGSGPSVAQRTAALSKLGFAPRHRAEPWRWAETSPDRGVRLVGTLPVGAVPVVSPPPPRQGVSGNRAPARPAVTRPPKRAKAVDSEPRRQPLAAPGRTARPLTAPPAAPRAELPQRVSPAAAALPAVEAARPAELAARQPIALPAATPRSGSMLPALAAPTAIEGGRT